MDQSGKLAFLNNLLDKELEALRQPPLPPAEAPMQDELLQLQNKIFSLEQKITSTNPLRTNLQVRDDRDESDEETPLKNKYAQQPSTNTRKNNHNSSQREDSNGSRRVQNFDLEKSIEQAESQLNGSLGNKKGRSGRQRSLQEGEKATRKISQMKSAFDQDKQVLQKEKARNQELLSQIGQLTKKMKRMQAQIDRSSQLEADFKKLQANFEKSEFIRGQQKNLIQNLKVEIEQIKREKGVQDENSHSRGVLARKGKSSSKKQ